MSSLTDPGQTQPEETVAPPARALRELSKADIAYAGGKGANLGELMRAGLPVPDGFVVGAPAFAAFARHDGLRDRLRRRLEHLQVDDVDELAAAAHDSRQMILEAPMPAEVQAAIRDHHAGMGDDSASSPFVAVRSSATAEDTESASFAGMHETLLNVHGEQAVVDAVRRCWASLFGARTLAYRVTARMPLVDLDIAVVVQRQINPTRSGVMFTIDPASGDRDRIVVEGSLGLGEAVVGGEVSPDHFEVDKATRSLASFTLGRKELVVEALPGGGTRRRPTRPDEAGARVLDDAELAALAELADRIERHYGAPQDTEWAIDATGRLWILQARPITAAGGAEPEPHAGAEGAVLVRGLGAAPGTATGRVRVVAGMEAARALEPGEVLVTRMTAPDWVPLMRRSAAVVTDSGGMTCHAAIVSRELGIPAVVGTGAATQRLRDGELVTVDATRGLVREGAAARAAAPDGRAAGEGPGTATAAIAAETTATRLMVNLSEPSQAEAAARLDVDGVGLVRAEMMLVEALGGRHPRKLMEDGRSHEFVERMTDALDTFATAFAPRPVTYRATDFRTNEFRGLEGGEAFEPAEANPMLGYRGALRYMADPALFRLELEALRRVYERGHDNVHLMLPFVRAPRELGACRRLVAESGLLEHRAFALWVMAEVPSVYFHLERYAAIGIAGISIGSNDLTQLMLGADRDSQLVSGAFDELDEAVTEYIAALIGRARDLGLATSICGQAPSVHPEYTELLVRAGIGAISVSPDAVPRTRRLIAAAERAILLEGARARVAD